MKKIKHIQIQWWSIISVCRCLRHLIPYLDLTCHSTTSIHLAAGRLISYYLTQELLLLLQKTLFIWFNCIRDNERTNLQWGRRKDLAKSVQPERDSILWRIVLHELCRACTDERRTGNRLNRIRTAKRRGHSHGNRWPWPESAETDLIYNWIIQIQILNSTQYDTKSLLLLYLTYSVERCLT